MDSQELVCKECSGSDFYLKYIAAYEYSYSIDSDAPGLLNTDEFMPFLYDNRVQTEGRQYIECKSCGAVYPYYGDISEGINYTYIKDAINNCNGIKSLKDK